MNAPRAVNQNAGPRSTEGLGRLRRGLVDVMLNRFGADRGRIEHALEVLRLAERIGKKTGADPLVVIPAAILHDIGRADPQWSGAAHCGANSCADAAEVLSAFDLPSYAKSEAGELIHYWHKRDRMTSPNGSTLFDAELIASLHGRRSPHWEAVLATVSLTAAGKDVGAAHLSRTNRLTAAQTDWGL